MARQVGTGRPALAVQFVHTLKKPSCVIQNGNQISSTELKVWKTSEKPWDLSSLSSYKTMIGIKKNLEMVIGIVIAANWILGTAVGKFGVCVDNHHQTASPCDDDDDAV